MLGIQRDNTTFQSVPDPQGNTYRASFELYPFYEGNDFAVYKGLLNGNSPKRGCFCVVKAMVDRKCNKEDWAHVLKISDTATNLASGFYDFLHKEKISFTSPLIAQMDSVSHFNGIVKCFRPHKKKLSSGEHVILEDFISDTLKTFSSASGIGDPRNETELTQAFSHFSWEDTRDFVICGLKGDRNKNGYHFTSPVIHSLAGRFGHNDCRWEGIVGFFSSHRCNNICTGWNIPDTTQFPVPSPHTFSFNPNDCYVIPATAPPPYSYIPPDPLYDTGNLPVYSYDGTNLGCSSKGDNYI